MRGRLLNLLGLVSSIRPFSTRRIKRSGQRSVLYKLANQMQAWALKYEEISDEKAKNAHDFALIVMNEFKTDLSIQADGCYILCVLTALNQNISVCIAQGEGFEIALAALNKFSTCFAIQLRVCIMIRNLSLRSENQTKIFMRGVSVLCDAMRIFPTTSDIQMESCVALYALLANEDEKRKEIFVELGGLQLLYDAMRQFPREECIQEAGCGLIKYLALQRSKLFNDLEVIPLLCSAMKLHPSHVNLQSSGCAALSVLTLVTYSSALIVKSGGIFTITNAMFICQNDPTVQEYGCTALYFLLLDYADGQTAFAVHGGVALARSAMINHSGNYAVWRFACALLLLADQSKTSGLIAACA